MKKKQGDFCQEGLQSGQVIVQPNWISVEDRLPQIAGEYYTISELQEDLPGSPKGTILVDTTDIWVDKESWQDRPRWRVLYWAERIRLAVPPELSDRKRIGND